MGSSFAAGAGADGLEAVLRRKYEEAFRNAAAKREQQRFDYQQAQDVENARRWNLGNERAIANDRSLAESRAAEAARDRAAADKDAMRQKGVADLIANPAALAALPPLQRLLTLNQFGVANVGIHDVEDPSQHQAHLTADETRKRSEGFADWQKRYDYENAHPRPQRIAGAALRDDPALPLGTQRYITQIASKHGGEFNAARAELDAYLTDPNTLRDHPHLNPVKAHDALRKMSARPSGASGDSLDDLITEATAGITGQQGAARVVGVGRPAARPAAGVSDAELVQRATKALQSNGYQPTPENIQKLLSNPQNRARLAGGQ